MSSDEEPDYMSEEFLAACVKDVRPGLVFQKSTKRQHQLEEKQQKANEKYREKNKPVRELEAERREEGMKEAIPVQNKGFAMLRKMGYNPGEGLGKAGEGRTEPVPVELKADRGGLGREAAIKEIVSRKLTMLARKISNQSSTSSLAEFRNRMKDQATQRLVAADLRKSQRMCENLDEQKGTDKPAEPWFWPEKEPEEEGDKKKLKLEEEVEDEKPKEDEDDQLEPTEKLELLTTYLRRVHLYCIWCGTLFDDDQDLSSNCPGFTREDH